MDARGALGKALVFLGWKGKKTVRSYVVPSNPNTTAQSTQRGHLTDSVAAWHAHAYNDLDFAAFNVLASIQSMIMSGFNAFCKVFMAQTKLANTITYPAGMTIVSNTGGSISISIAASGTVAGKLRWGLSPSVMGTSVSLTKSLTTDPYTGTITGLTAKDYIYFQLYTETAANFIMSGIYKVLVLA
jgi:hypothetical protein